MCTQNHHLNFNSTHCASGLLKTQGHSRSQQRSNQRILLLTLKFLALKKTCFSPRKNTSRNFLTFLNLYSMQLFSADATNFLKSNSNLLFLHENIKKRASKVAHNPLQTFFPQVLPDCPKQPRIDFSYYKYVPRLIYLLICAQR